MQIIKGWGGISILFVPFPLCFQVGAICCTLFATARMQRPVLHAGNILIYLEDDSVTLDDDSSTLIGNEATETRDEWKGRKCASV